MILKKTILLKIAACAMVLALATSCFAAEKFINYQGMLTDSEGLPVTGGIDVYFSIWNDAHETDPALGRLWGEAQVLEAANGIFNAMIGGVTPLETSIDFASPDLYLEVSINGATLSPRTQLTTVPASFWAEKSGNANTLDNLDSLAFAKKSELVTGGSGVTVSWENLADVPAAFADGIDNVGDRNTLDASDGNPAGAVYVDSLGNVGIGTTKPSQKLQVNGTISASRVETADLYAANTLSANRLDVGSIGVTGLVDGRDIASDGAKLDSLVFSGGADTTNDSWTGTTTMYTTAGKVGIGTTAPGAALHLKMAGTTISYGIRLETSLGTGEDWYAYMNGADDLVFRNDGSDYVWFQKNTGNVGIGKSAPASKLDVNGDIAVTGLVDGRDIAADGEALDSIVIGGGADTTNDAWTGLTDIYTTAGNVSIGTTSAEGYRLNALAHTDGRAAVRGIDFERVGTFPLQVPMLYAGGQLGSFNPSWLPTDPGHVGVLGWKTQFGAPGVGVYAWNSDDAVNNTALYAVADGSPGTTGSNYGIYAEAVNGSTILGTNYGIYARAEGGPVNYAGYFAGDVKTTGNIHAVGDFTTEGTIHAAGGFTSGGTVEFTGNVLGTKAVMSTPGTIAVQGTSTYAGSMSTPYGGYFTAAGSKGRGVYGSASATGGVKNYGGYFESAGDQGQGVYALASGSTGYGGYFSATGDWGTGIYAEGTGMETSYAAVFKGNVQLLSKTTGDPVLELGEGLDYAEGFDVSDEQRISAGTVLVIDPDTPGKLKICDEDYDLKVAGVVAGAKGLGSGVRLGAGRFDLDVALAGRVYCNVRAGKTGIKPGDQLTTSSLPGYAMKASDHARSRGAILGKAMEGLEAGGEGQILVLVTLQ